MIRSIDSIDRLVGKTCLVGALFCLSLINAQAQAATLNAAGDDPQEYRMRSSSQTRGITPQFPGEVIKAFPAPAGGSAGSTWINGRLIHGDTSTGRIYTIDPNTGAVLSSFSSAFVNGLAYDGTNLWGSSATSDSIAQMNPADGSVIMSFPSPGTGPLGLAFDGTSLWNADWETNLVYQIDPADGTMLSSFATPDARPSGLTFDGQLLWVANRDADTITQVDQLNAGAIVTTIPAPGQNGEGLAFDGSYLWNSDLFDDLISQLDTGLVFPKLTVSPPSGKYALTQSFDITLLVEDTVQAVTGATVLLDGGDVSAPYQSCAILGSLANGVTFRCPSIPGSFIGAGIHQLEVTVDLASGSSLSNSVSWEILDSSEP